MSVTKGNVFFVTIRKDTALVIKNIISHVSLKEFSIDFDANPSGNVILASVSTLCSCQVMLWNQFIAKSTKRNPSFISKWLSTCCNMKAQAGVKVFRAYAEGENTDYNRYIHLFNISSMLSCFLNACVCFCLIHIALFILLHCCIYTHYVIFVSGGMMRLTCSW